MAKTPKTAANQAPKPAQSVGAKSASPLAFASKTTPKGRPMGGKSGKKC